VVKLTDYRNQIEMLETSDNPFALATLAHLETQQTRKNAFMRFESKLRFTRNLYIRGWSRNKIIELFHFIDWIMQLPSELEDKLWVEINKIEEEGKMPYISSVERIGYLLHAALRKFDNWLEVNTVRHEIDGMIL
jgi:hypothetical protein